MIKKLHYVWLGGNPLPSAVKSCINSWKKHLPDWEIIQWNEKNFEVDKFPWVKEALKNKKYAFAADFIRFYVLDIYGGGYCDTDVEICRDITPLLSHSFVGALEFIRPVEDLQHISEEGIDRKTGKMADAIGLQAGFFYAEPHHPFIKRMLETRYDNGMRRFINDDGTNNAFVVDGAMIDVLREEYGLKYKNETQRLADDIVVHDCSIFATRKTKTPESYVIHWFDQSWKEDKGLQKLKKWIKKHLYYVYRMQ